MTVVILIIMFCDSSQTQSQYSKLHFIWSLHCDVVYLSRVCACSPRHWRISLVFLLIRERNVCRTRLMTSTRSYRKREIRGTSPWLRRLHRCVYSYYACTCLCLLICWCFSLSVSEALNKMKGVYELNSQLGDPSSLEPQITQTSSNIVSLKEKLKKYQVHTHTHTYSNKNIYVLCIEVCVCVL